MHPEESSVRLDARRAGAAHGFELEHTLRFAQHMLHWVLPRVRLPEQADRRTAVVVAAYTELRLPRACEINACPVSGHSRGSG